jgi:transcriptional regulator with XRE-family HTH domain
MTAREITARFGQWLRTARTLQGRTQVEVAERLASEGFVCHQTKIAKIEQGTQEPSLAFALALFRLFDTTPDVALGLADCPQCKGEPPEGFTCNTCGRAS